MCHWFECYRNCFLKKKRNIFWAINVRAPNTYDHKIQSFFGDRSLVKRKSPATSDTKRKNENKKRCCRPNCLFFTYLLLFYFFFLLLLFFLDEVCSVDFPLFVFNVCSFFKNEFCNSTGGRWFIQILSSYFLSNHIVNWLVNVCILHSSTIQYCQERFKNMSSRNLYSMRANRMQTYFVIEEFGAQDIDWINTISKENLNLSSK